MSTADHNPPKKPKGHRFRFSSVKDLVSARALFSAYRDLKGLAVGAGGRR